MADRRELWIENDNVSEIMSMNDNFDWHNLWKIDESLDRSMYVSKDMSHNNGRLMSRRKNQEELECLRLWQIRERESSEQDNLCQIKRVRMSQNYSKSKRALKRSIYVPSKKS